MLFLYIKIVNKINNTEMNEEISGNLNNDCEVLTNIIQSGADEFKKKIGRQMTYSEMREMFG
jgi:hypothetical protein